MLSRTEKYKKERELIKLENDIEKIFSDFFIDGNEVVDTLNICGKKIKVTMDDYGQCYILNWLDDDGNLCSECCGTYNFEYEEYAKMKFDENYRLSWYRDIGIVLASDREFLCKKVVEALYKLPKFMQRRLIGDLPFYGRPKEEAFRMLFGTWEGGKE